MAGPSSQLTGVELNFKETNYKVLESKVVMQLVILSKLKHVFYYCHMAYFGELLIV